MPEATKADLFTSAAQLVRVVDGDTFVVALEISPGEFLEQKLRLRGLAAPDISRRKENVRSSLLKRGSAMQSAARS